MATSNVNIETAIANAMAAVMPTMAEAIAKAIASTMAAPIEQTHIEASTPTAEPEPKAEPSAEPTPMEQTIDKIAKIFEYSDKCWAIVGVAKEDKDIIKGLAKDKHDVTFVQQLRAYHDEVGWVVSKKSYPDMNVIGAILAKGGYTIEMGESVAAISAELKAKREAEKKAAEAAKVEPKAEAKASTPTAPTVPSTPKAEQPKVRPMVTPDFNVASFDGLLHDHKGGITEGKVKQIPTLHEAYYTLNAKGKEEVYLYAGTDANGRYHFLDMGGGLTFDSQYLADGGVLQYHDNVKAVASKGLAYAYSEGLVREVYKWQAEAYRAGGNKEVADYLDKVAVKKTTKKTA